MKKSPAVQLFLKRRVRSCGESPVALFSAVLCVFSQFSLDLLKDFCEFCKIPPEFFSARCARRFLQNTPKNFLRAGAQENLVNSWGGGFIPN